MPACCRTYSPPKSWAKRSGGQDRNQMCSTLTCTQKHTFTTNTASRLSCNPTGLRCQKGSHQTDPCDERRTHYPVRAKQNLMAVHLHEALPFDATRKMVPAVGARGSPESRHQAHTLLVNPMFDAAMTDAGHDIPHDHTITTRMKVIARMNKT